MWKTLEPGPFVLVAYRFALLSFGFSLPSKFMNKDKIWDNVLSSLSLDLSPGVFKTMFRGSNLVSFENNVATVGVANPLIKQYVEGRYYALVKASLDKQLGVGTSVVFAVLPREHEAVSLSPGPLFLNHEEVKPKSKNFSLSDNFTFENFAVSGSNQLAYAAAVAVSKAPGSSYNPLFIYGGVGVGKTHLMLAIGREALRLNSKLKILYSPGEEFTNGIIQAIQTKTTQAFKDKFRSLDILMLDDVQFIAGKVAVQEEFFHTFNAIHRAGGQIILTSDRPPSEIARLEERLRSRFEGGMIVDVAPPDFELRCAILLIKARQRGISLTMEAATYIAQDILSPRRLEGALVRLLSEAEMRKEPISLSLVQAVLGKKDRGEPINTNLSEKDVLETIASYFETKVSLLKGVKRDQGIVFPRQIAMYVLRKDLDMGFIEIGGALGGRDHSTVIHGVGKIEGMLAKNNRVRQQVEEIRRRLQTRG